MNGKNKKVIAGVLAASMALSTTAFAAISDTVEGVSTEVLRLGDINGDTEITLADATLALKAALKIDPLTPAQLAAADVDKSGSVDLADAKAILEAALKIKPLPTVSETPAASETPDVSETPTVSEAPSAPAESKAPSKPSRAPLPSTKPVAPTTQTPVPVAPTIPTVEPADYVVTGQAVELIATNGAVEANGIYTFTQANKDLKKGIQFAWPYSDRKDLRQTVTDTGVTLENLISVPKKYLEKGDLEKLVDATGDIDYNYPRPEWTNGVSVSFWSKQKWEENNKSNIGPLLVIKRSEYCDWCFETGYDPGYGGAIKHHGQKENCDFGLVVYANGSVSFAAGDEAKNAFRAGSYIADKDNEWTHYTVTIANDFITVYVNGQEMVYQSINLDKDASSECFNNGFLTRYNPSSLVTQKMLDADIRGYLTAPTVGSSTKRPAAEMKDGKIITNWEATLTGNGRYKDGCTLSSYMLLMDLLTEDNVEMYIGGLPADEVCCIKSSNTGYADYDTPNDSQVTGVTCYESELKPAEVAAVYEYSKDTYKDVLGLK